MSTDPLKRLGPLERAIRTKDGNLFLATIESRCTKDPVTRCWLWNGARRAEGYPYIGRGRSQRLAHRAVWIAKTGFIYGNDEVPAIHHICGVRICLNPEHLSPATAVQNSAEMFARIAYTERIATLTKALRAENPEHSLLRHPWPGEVDPPAEINIENRREFESERLRVRRVISKTNYQIRLQENQNKRFQQVLDVEKAYSTGFPMKEALKQAGLGRSAYYEWRAHLRKQLANPETIG